MKKLLATLLLALSLPALAAIDIAGVKFTDTEKVGAGETALNGAGMRGMLIIKGYAMALYLPQKASTTAEVLAQKGAKRIRIVLLRDSSGEAFADALPNGIRKNHNEQEIAALNPRIESLRTTLLGIPSVAKGATILLDWLPEINGGVTRLTVSGEKKGEDIAGEDFYQAVLRIWIGDKPVQGDLKEGLLGKAAGR